MYLYIINNSFKNINYFNIFSFEIVVVNNEFIFNLDFLIFEGRVFLSERGFEFKIFKDFELISTGDTYTVLFRSRYLIIFYFF